jgi:hypothetical protein
MSQIESLSQEYQVYCSALALLGRVSKDGTEEWALRKEEHPLLQQITEPAVRRAELQTTRDKIAAEIAKISHQEALAADREAQEEKMAALEASYASISDAELQTRLQAARAAANAAERELEALSAESVRRSAVRDAEKELDKLSPTAKRVLVQRLQVANTEKKTTVGSAGVQ